MSTALVTAKGLVQDSIPSLLEWLGIRSVSFFTCLPLIGLVSLTHLTGHFLESRYPLPKQPIHPFYAFLCVTFAAVVTAFFWYTFSASRMFNVVVGSYLVSAIVIHAAYHGLQCALASSSMTTKDADKNAWGFPDFSKKLFVLADAVLYVSIYLLLLIDQLIRPYVF